MNSSSEIPNYFVDAWIINLDRSTSPGDSSLNAQELKRAGRFKTEQLRFRWASSRSALRHILSEYLSISPMQVEFGEGSNGKPFIANPASEQQLYFNLSHAGSRGLVAVTNRAEIGADLELIKPFDNMREVARRFFCEAEKSALEQLGDEDKHLAFYRLWTRKEALLKATGKGLGLPLSCFHVSSDSRARVIAVDGDLGDVHQWYLDSRSLDKEYVCALAMYGYRFKARWREYR